jgi:hypothetical protein
MLVRRVGQALSKKELPALDSALFQILLYLKSLHDKRKQLHLK